MTSKPNHENDTPKRGPEAKRLKIKDNWKDAVKQALNKKPERDDEKKTEQAENDDE